MLLAYLKNRSKKNAPNECPHGSTVVTESAEAGNTTAREESNDAKNSRSTHRLSVFSRSNPVKQTKATQCEQCRLENKAKLKYRWKLILALLLPGFIGALDLTIVATALPFIASDFCESSDMIVLTISCCPC